MLSYSGADPPGSLTNRVGHRHLQYAELKKHGIVPRKNY